MALCNFCGATFRSRQGVRAHLKGCTAYHAHREADASNEVPSGKGLSGGKPVSGNLPNRHGLMPKAMPQEVAWPPQGSRLDEEAVGVVLRVHEELRDLRQEIIAELPIRRLLNNTPPDDGSPDYGEWYELAKDLVHLEQVTDRIVSQARVSRDEPWELHKLTLAVRERWVSWRREEAHRTWEKDGEAQGKSPDDFLDKFRVPDLEHRLSRLVEGLRWLVSHTRAVL